MSKIYTVGHKNKILALIWILTKKYNFFTNKDRDFSSSLFSSFYVLLPIINLKKSFQYTKTKLLTIVRMPHMISNFNELSTAQFSTDNIVVHIFAIYMHLTF